MDIQAFCPDEIMSDDYDSSAQILKMFTKQNNRVLRIFDQSQDSESNDDQSYEIRLVSKTRIESQDDDSDPSNKENEAESEIPPSQRESFRNLSPVEIVTVSSQEISERLPPAQPQNFKKPEVNKSLRRSLFRNKDLENSDDVPFSSTPNRRKDTQGRFFSGENNVERPSPIRLGELSQSPIRPIVEKNKSKASSVEKNAGDISKTPRPNKSNHVMKIQAVPTISLIEESLRERYNIENSQKQILQSTPKRTSRSSMQRNQSLVQRNVVVELERIDVSAAQMMSQPEKSRNISSRTDYNSMRMVETPIHRTTRSSVPPVDQEVVERMRRCEESEDENEMTEDELTEEPVRETRKSKQREKTPEFRVPRDKEPEEPETSSLNSSTTRNVPSDIVKSFRSLAKRTQEADSTSIRSDIQSLTINKPPRTRSRKPSVDPYSTAKKSKKSKEQTNRKRTLYTSILEPDEPTSSSRDSGQPQSPAEEAERNSRDSDQQRSSRGSDQQRSSRGSDQQRSSRGSDQQRSSRGSDQQRSSREENERNSREDFEQDENMSEPEVSTEEEETPPKIAKKSTKSNKKKQKPVEPHEDFEQDENMSEPEVSPEEEESPPKVTKKSTKSNKKKQKPVEPPEDFEQDENMSEPEVSPEREESPLKITKKSTKSNKKTQKPVEPPKPKPSRKRRQEESDETNEDEGFDSDNSDSKVRYDPYKHGCTRPGLRKRRFVTPWWSTHEEDYGLVYGDLKRGDIRTAKVLDSKIKKAGIRKSEILNTTVEKCSRPKDQLKILEQKKDQIKEVKRLAKEKEKLKTKKNAVEPKKAAEPKKTVEKGSRKVAQSESRMSPESSIQQSSTSMQTCQTSYSVAQSYANLVESISKNSKNPGFKKGSVYQNESYDVASAKEIRFQDCGNGVYFGPFIDKLSDGLIKLIPGGKKPRARSKNSCLKFFVLAGSLTVIVGKTKIKVDSFTYINIHPGRKYQLMNETDQEVLIHFTRFEASSSVTE